MQVLKRYLRCLKSRNVGKSGCNSDSIQVIQVLTILKTQKAYTLKIELLIKILYF